MTWVVYIIDFFIAIKNKIKFFSNYRDITIFLTMFLTMLACLFAVKPLSSDSVMFDVLNKNSFMSILQITVISCIWTFLCAKTRNINLNFCCDKMTNRDTSSEEYKEIKLNLEQTQKLQLLEKRIYIIEYVLTLVVSFFQALQILTIIPTSYQNILYFVLMAFNFYYLYMGSCKNFKYRILELIPYALMLALLVIVNSSTGILISLITFIFVLYNMIKNKVKVKRVKSFSISYIVAVIICLVVNFAIPNINNIKNIEFSSDIFSTKRVEVYDEYLEKSTSATEFNALKDMFSNRIEKLKDTSSIFLYKNFYVYICIFLSMLLVFLNSKKEYIFFAILMILNSIYIMQYDIYSSLYFVIFASFVLVLYTVHSIIRKILDK